MTLPTTTAKLGPGTLEIGALGTEIDVSCLVNNAVIAADKDEGDATTKLCGDTRAGSVTYTYSLSGNMDTDIADEAGFFALSQTAPGTQQSFVFTPSTAAGTSATGTLTIDPLDFGADESGADLTSDFEFTIVGKPTYTYPTGAAARDYDPAANRVVDGVPATYEDAEGDTPKRRRRASASR
jgi:hypothetical protein